MEILTTLIPDAGPAGWSLLLATFLVAGAVKGVSGLGLPTVAIALLSLRMPPADAAALLIVPSLVTNVWQMLAGAHLRTLARRLWPMLAGICAGTWLGAWLIGPVAPAWAAMALGVALMLYALVGLAAVKLRVPARQGSWLGPLIGALTGGVTAVTGVFVLPAVPYLQGLQFNKDELVQSMGLAFTCSTLALAVNLAASGHLQGGAAGVSLLAVLPALLGMGLGQWLRARVSQTTFRRIFFSALLLLGAHQALKGWL